MKFVYYYRNDVSRNKNNQPDEKIAFKVFKIIVASFIMIIFFPLSVLATVASSSTIYQGIDVSNWQGSIDYNTVKESGIDIVYIKASQGIDVVDSYFRINYNNAKANGLKVGFYHYLTARTEQQAIEQADFFASVISNTVPDCKLAMDFESFGNLTNEEINQIAQTFLERLETTTGKEVIIYSDTSNARNIFRAELASRYPLWVAEYGVENPGETNWEFWEGFQFTDMGEVPGIQGFVDKDRFTEDILLDSSTQIPESGNKENYNQDTEYIVQCGNTLTSIAHKYGTSVRALVALNGIQNPNLIFTGEKLIVPINSNIGSTESLFDAGHTIYTVKPGDTLSALAIEFRTTVDSIAKLNGIENINLIFVGQKLRI